MNPWLLGGLALAAIGAVGLAVYASGPGTECPTKAQQQKAFDDVKTGAINAAGVEAVIAPVWERCGLKYELEALRFSAKNPGKVPLILTGPIYTAPSPTKPTGTADDGLGGSPKIPGTSIAVPPSFPTNPHKDAPAFGCGTSDGGRKFAVDFVMVTSGSSMATKEMADMLTVFAQQLAYCGHMADATTVGQRAEYIRSSSASATGFGRADRCAPPHVVAMRARRRAA